MRKLLSADFFRLWKSKELYLLSIAIFVSAICRTFSGMKDPNNALEDGFFIYALFTGIIMAAFVSLFAGTDLGNIARNKLIVGHRRRDIYLSNYIVCTVAGFIFCICYFLPSYLLGLCLYGAFHTGLSDVVLTVLGIFLLTAVYSSIFLLVAILNVKRAVVVVISVWVTFLFLVLGLMIKSRLEQPEQNWMYFVTSEYDDIDPVEEAPPVVEMVPAGENPLYIRGLQRKIYEFLNDVLPGGQSISLSGMMDEPAAPPARIFVFEGFWILFLNVMGLAAFNKRNLK